MAEATVENFTVPFVPSAEVKPKEEPKAAPEVKEPEVKAEPKPAPPVKEPDDMETRARKMGWRPLEKFGGDPETWVDAEEFVKRAPLYKENKKLKDRLSDAEKTLIMTRDHITKVQQAAYQKAYNELMAQRKEAIALGDVNKVEQIEGQLQQQAMLAQPPPPVVQTSPVVQTVQDWMKDRPWFNASEEPEMTRFAAIYYGSLGGDNAPDVAEALRKTEEAVQKAFPDRFEAEEPTNGQQPQRAASPVEGVSSRGRSNPRFTYNDLTDDEKRVCDRFVRSKVMTRDEYVKDIAEQRGY